VKALCQWSLRQRAFKIVPDLFFRKDHNAPMQDIVREIFGKELIMTLSSVIESSNHIIVSTTCYLESHRKLISQPDS
jgi:hypothetical protein